MSVGNFLPVYYYHITFNIRVSKFSLSNFISILGKIQKSENNEKNLYIYLFISSRKKIGSLNISRSLVKFLNQSFQQRSRKKIKLSYPESFFKTEFILI